MSGVSLQRYLRPAGLRGCPLRGRVVLWVGKMRWHGMPTEPAMLAVRGFERGREFANRECPSVIEPVTVTSSSTVTAVGTEVREPGTLASEASKSFSVSKYHQVFSDSKLTLHCRPQCLFSQALRTKVFLQF